MADTNAIVSLLLLLLLGLFIYGPWQEICTDFARQIIFEKRDAIFDLADSDKWSFDNREYRAIRSGLEKLIRFAHELTLPSLLFLFIFIKPSATNDKPEMLRAVERIRDENLRTEVSKLVDEALMACLGMMILKSPVTIILTIMLIPILCVRRVAEYFFGRSKIVIQFEAERVDALKDATAA